MHVTNCFAPDPTIVIADQQDTWNMWRAKAFTPPTAKSRVNGTTAVETTAVHITASLIQPILHITGLCQFSGSSHMTRTLPAGMLVFSISETSDRSGIAKLTQNDMHAYTHSNSTWMEFWPLNRNSAHHQHNESAHMYASTTSTCTKDSAGDNCCMIIFLLNMHNIWHLPQGNPHKHTRSTHGMRNRPLVVGVLH